ncbi:MAG: Putative phosphatidyltransferase [Anaerolinea thermophila]|jgi:phosphatidylglycerophosphate synthase|uniref:Putative phosphatidyltransferase n=1 Tax=Anaerolinea thermophila TaxID=167964 RepID=A0A101FWM0_9CHLR|nr:MAG: Putative phosphatidyltransferase [Anaerolinea thermophila]
MSKVENHKRENDILLGFLERPALKWLAAHMPAWVTPDVLTSLGIIASILIFVSYALTNVSQYFLILASFGFVLNWFGDSLDGTLARYRHIERPRYGFLIDHYVDAISAVLIFIGLGVSPYVDLTVASMGVIAYLLVSIMVYLITYVTGVFQITSVKIGPTEIRLLAIIANTSMLIIGNPKVNLPIFGQTTLYTLVVGLVALVMTLYFLINTSIQARKLKLLDEKQLERKQEKLKNAAENHETITPAASKH